MFVKDPFSFSSDCKTLEQSLKKAVAVVGTKASFFLGVYKKNVVVLGLSPDTFVMLSIPNSETASASGVFGFDPEVLPGLIKGRSILDFKFSGSECLFSQVKGKYKGTLKTVEITDDQQRQIEEKISTKVKAATLAPETFAKIKAGISASGVNDVYQKTPLMAFVVLEGGKLIISSFDSQHFGLYRTKLDDTTALKVALPQAHFSLVEQLASGQEVKLSLSQSSLRAQGPNFIAVLPATQSDERHFNLVPGFISSLKEPVYTATCDLAALTSVAENLYTLYNSNTNFEISTRGQELRIGLTTSSGSASDVVEVKSTSKPVKLNVDPRLLMDILQLSKPLAKTQLRVTDKVLVIVGRKDGAEVQLVCSRVS